MQTVFNYEMCPKCNGRGFSVSLTDVFECGECGGTGMVRESIDYGLGYPKKDSESGAGA